MADRSFVAKNDAERRRLRALVDGLDEDGLATPTDAGWTVAAVLAHMAFWDYRIVALIERWGPDATGPSPTHEGDDVDWINDANKRIFLALPPLLAARVALDAAEAADAAVAALSDDLLATEELRSLLINPFRSDHRGEHLDDLERALGRSGRG